MHAEKNQKKFFLEERQKQKFEEHFFCKIEHKKPKSQKKTGIQIKKKTKESTDYCFVNQLIIILEQIEITHCLFFFSWSYNNKLSKVAKILQLFR